MLLERIALKSRHLNIKEIFMSCHGSTTLECVPCGSSVRIGLLLMSLVVGATATIGDQIRLMDHLLLSPPAVLHSLWYSAAFYCFVLLMEKVLVWVQLSPSTRGCQWLRFDASWHSMLIIAACIFMCWMPYLLYLWPGAIWYDTSNQLLQWFHLPNLFTQGQLNDQHPVFDTMIFGLFVQFGNLFGSGDHGIFLYTVVQSLCTALAFSYSLQYMKSIGVSRKMIRFMMLFICFFPLIPMFAVVMVKESVFLPIFICFSIEFIKIVRTQGAVLSNVNKFVIFLVLSVLIALTRKTGIYISVISCTALLFIVKRKYFVRVMSAAGATVLIVGIALPLALFPTFNIQEGGKQEMLSVPFQQTARLMRDHGNEFTVAQKRIVYRVIGPDLVKNYNPYDADPVKGFVWDTKKNEYLGQYMKIWFSGLIAHPITYVEAFIAMEYAWLAMPTASSPDVDNRLLPVLATGTNHSFFEGHEKIGLTSSQTNHGANVEKGVRWLQQTSFGMVLFSRALWTTWMIAFVLYEVLRSRRSSRLSSLIAVMPYIVSYLFLWISPTSASIEAVRYMIPQIYLFPLFISIISVACLQGQQQSNINRMDNQ